MQALCLALLALSAVCPRSVSALHQFDAPIINGDAAIFPCLNGCSGHGACFNGTCDCDYLWTANDCAVPRSSSTTPVPTCKGGYERDLDNFDWEFDFSHWDGTGNVCRECKPGYYSYGGESQCTACPLGYTSAAGSNSPMDCESITGPELSNYDPIHWSVGSVCDTIYDVLTTGSIMCEFNNMWIHVNDTHDNIESVCSIHREHQCHRIDTKMENPATKYMGIVWHKDDFDLRTKKNVTVATRTVNRTSIDFSEFSVDFSELSLPDFIPKFAETLRIRQTNDMGEPQYPVSVDTEENGRILHLDIYDGIHHNSESIKRALQLGLETTFYFSPRNFTVSAAYTMETIISSFPRRDEKTWICLRVEETSIIRRILSKQDKGTCNRIRPIATNQFYPYIVFPRTRYIALEPCEPISTYQMNKLQLQSVYSIMQCADICYMTIECDFFKSDNASCWVGTNTRPLDMTLPISGHTCSPVAPQSSPTVYIPGNTENIAYRYYDSLSLSYYAFQCEHTGRSVSKIPLNPFCANEIYYDLLRGHDQGHDAPMACLFECARLHENMDYDFMTVDFPSSVDFRHDVDFHHGILQMKYNITCEIHEYKNTTLEHFSECEQFYDIKLNAASEKGNVASMKAIYKKVEKCMDGYTAVDDRSAWENF